MSDKEIIDMLVEGGKAAPGAATAPRFSAMKVNVGDVFKQVNEKTKECAGMQVPVKVVVDKKTKEFEIVVGTPPVSSLIKKEIGAELLKITPEEKTAGKTHVGEIKMEQVVKVAKMKKDAMLAKDLKGAVKQVVGSCASMPILVEGKKAQEVIREIDEGKWDELIK